MAVELLMPTGLSENYPNLGIVLVNHLGATSQTDTGHDGRHIAHELRVPVVVVDRPGTNLPLFDGDRTRADRLSTPDGYVNELALLARAINTRLQQASVERSLIMGRSAGGLGALALARAAVINTQQAVYAAEPVGCEQMSVAEGKRRYRSYRRRQKQLQSEASKGRIDLILPESPDLPLGSRLNRLVRMVPDSIVDRRNNKHIWASNAAIRYAAEIGKLNPSTTVVIDFAEHSMVMPEVDQPDLLNGLNSMTHVTARQVPQTTHASFDNRGFLLERVRPVLQSLAIQ